MIVLNRSLKLKHDNKNSHRAAVLMVIACLFLSACSARTRLDYAAPTAYSIPNLTGKVSLTVIDHRRYVLNGTKRPTYVGRAPNALGIISDAHTISTKALSDELADSIAAAFASHSIEVEKIAVSPTQSLEHFLSSIGRKKGLSRAGIILEIVEWNSAENSDFKLAYQLNLKIISSTQKEVVQLTKQGEKTSTAELEHFLINDILNELFSDKKISNKLGAPRKAVTPKKKAVVTSKPTAAATPRPTATPKLATTPLATPTAKPSPTTTASAKATATPQKAASPVVTAVATAQPTATATVTLQATKTATASPTPIVIMITKPTLKATEIPVAKPTVVPTVSVPVSNTLSELPEIDDGAPPVVRPAQPNQPPASVNGEGCNPWHVIEMQKKGYTEEQITAACR